MSYVESNLAPGEVVDYRGQVSWFFALRRVFLFVGVALLFYAVGVKAVGTGILVVTLVAVVRAVILVATSEYVVTDRRVIGKYGLIQRQSVDVMMTAISGVTTANGVFGRIFGYGTVWVNGNGTRRALVGVHNPGAFSQAVYARLENSRLLMGTAAYTLNVQQVHTPASQPTHGMTAGWYPDQSDAGLLRYFDGKIWTSHTSPR